MFKLGFTLFLVGFFLVFIGTMPRETITLMSEALRIFVLFSMIIGITLMLFGSLQD